jgi:OmcA/MtrC family decaheme c-type cytochrome
MGVRIMTLLNARQPVRPSPRWVALLACAAMALAACSGEDAKSGAEGPTGPVGPPGQPPAGGGVPVSSAKSINASIVSASVPDDGKPVIEVRLVNESGQPLSGLAAANISFVLARLEPGVNGKSSTWRAITRRTEAFPGSPAPVPASAVTGTGPTNQATTEPATRGKWVESTAGNGVYTYTFAQSLQGISDIPYDAALVHRVGLEIRLRPAGASEPIPASNGVFTWTPATGGPVESGREIVDNDTCNKCHEELTFHGGARFDLQYCAMCHESYSYDAQSGNSIDLKVMIHKIHAGATLPSVQAGGFYGIFGFGNTFTDYSDVVYPQDKRNCTTCHEEADADTPQAGNWRTTVNRQVCSSCHDNVNFTTGENHGGVSATDDSCTACHGPHAALDGLSVDQAHVIPEQEAARRFKYEVLQIVDSAPGQRPTVTIRVVDPTNNDAPYDIKAAGGPFQNSAASLAVDVAFPTRPDFMNTGSGSATATTGAPAQPIRIDFKANGVPDPAFPGSFKATAAVAIPVGTIGSGKALLEGRAGVDVNGDGTLERIAVPSVGKAFAITDAVPVDYRKIVDIAKCNDCHQQLSLHGESRTGNDELCAACHNPNATDIARRVAGSNCETVTGTTDDQTIDLKYMVHAIHAGEVAAYKVCGFNNTGYDFSHVKYPGRINNCEGCHLPDTYYPPDSATAIATTIDAAPATNPDRSTPLGDIAITPATAVCSSCHTGASARVHMELNGGSFNAVKAADSTTPGAPVETCGTCHGPGRPADVKVMHGVAGFQ